MLENSAMTIDNKDWELSSYLYDLPSELIATRPADRRDASRLLVYNEETQKISHHQFSELKTLLPSNHHLVFNNSKVYPCRLLGQKESGGACELFLLNLGVERDFIYYYDCLIKARGTKVIGQKFQFDEYVSASISEILGDGTFRVSFNLDHEYLMDYLERKALIPLPPYIRGGESDERDKDDYQTVYAKELGSVAAPTAGLHFTKKMLNEIPHSYVSLHVGLGTFKPVMSESIKDHDIHTESFSIETNDLKNINAHKDHLIAVGTTSLRVLESCYDKSTREFVAKEGENKTNIFLYPGVPVHSISGLITNFHLPGSSLIMLVSALIGREKTLELYDIAIKNKYRFFSYGDAMLILRKKNV